MNMFKNCDCFDGFKQIADGSVDLILTDPPFGITENKWDTAPDLPAMWAEFKRVVKPVGAFVIFADGLFLAELMLSNKQNWKYNLIYSKTRATDFMNCNVKPLKSHEYICVFGNGAGMTYNPQFTYGKPYVRTRKGGIISANYGKFLRNCTTVSDGRRYPTTVLEFPFDDVMHDFRHPTQKPLALCKWLIDTYSNEGEMVLDPFAGSASTLVAARNAGRKYAGFEKNEQYFTHAMKRLKLAESVVTLFDVVRVEND